MQETLPQPRAVRFIRRALRLRCPECGISRIFKPWRQTRSLDDWFRTLHGCPQCEYTYEREQGYFLLAIWGLNYGLIAGVGLGGALLLHALFSAPLWIIILFVFLPMPFFSFFFARHAKALFLALDHYYDPQAKPSPSPMEQKQD